MSENKNCASPIWVSTDMGRYKIDCSQCAVCRASIAQIKSQLKAVLPRTKKPEGLRKLSSGLLIAALLAGCGNNVSINAAVTENKTVAADKTSSTEKTPDTVVATTPASTASPSPTPTPSLVTVSQVSATPDRSDYPATNIMDGSNTTFMTTHTVASGAEVKVTFQLQSETTPRRFEVSIPQTYYDYCQEAQVRAMIGTPTFYGSNDNSTWTAITISSNTGYENLWAKYVLTGSAAYSYLQLRMKHQGQGLCGGSFYLGEAKIYGV